MTNHDRVNGINGGDEAHVNGLAKDFREVLDSPTAEPIAIVGMGMRLPGNVNNGEDFWQLMMEKRDGRIRVPEDRYNVDAFYNANGKPGTVRTQYGNFLQGNLKHLDTSFFSMTRSETEKLDPQARLLLEVSREALENAGETNWRGKDIGCYVGVFGEDWQDIHLKDSQDAGMYRVTGYGDFLLGNRISYEYDMKGPSLTVKTGCSSSLIALHMACQAIQNKECDGAIVGGTNLIMSPTMTIAMSEQGVLSSGAACKTFDSRADGYCRGEAINALYVKRLNDAVRDGNPIQAVIRSTATNCDGRTPGISHPSSISHEALLRHAYKAAGLTDFNKMGFVECHGTGTAIGDPLEAQAVANVFGEKGIYIGSSKPNVGHSEGASGVTGAIKAILALQHKIIPPNINFETPNPKLPFDKLKVPTEPIAWPADRAERVAVNSFGLGGANATAIIESAASWGLESKPVEGAAQTSTRPQLLVFSANHTESLNKIVENCRNYIEQKPGAVSDLAYTLGARREHLPFRTFCVAEGATMSEGQPGVKPNAKPKLNFIFTGQGAQWLGMGKELITEYPSVLDDVRAMDKALQALPHAPSWSIEGELLELGSPGGDEVAKQKRAVRFGKAEFAQPLCTAIQVAIVNLLRSWGIKPEAVAGHSSGEIGAAYAANAITLEEAIVVAFYRGWATKKQTRAGGMAAVGMGKEDVSPFLIDGTVVACENSPSSVTLSGDIDQLDKVVESIKEKSPGTFARALKVEMAYHSYHMAEIGEEYQSTIQGRVQAKAPEVSFYSSVLGELITEEGVLGPKYWRQNLESPVLFSAAVQALLKHTPADQVFLEIGPHSALQGPLRHIFKAAGATNPAYASALVRSTSGVQTLLQAVGQLYVKGVAINFAAMAPGNVLHDLPAYPWNHDAEYWDESRISKEWRLRKYPHHDVLGSRITDGSNLEPTWRNMLRLEEVPWIRDHQIATDTIFPGAGYVAMAGEAIRQLTENEDFAVREVVISQAMVVNESTATEVLTTLRPLRLTNSLDSVWYEFSIVSNNQGNWTKHCWGQVRAGPEFEPVSKPQSKLPRDVSSGRWYQAMRKVGLNYGGRFVGLKNISTGTKDRVALANMENILEPNEAAYQLHPSTLDLCIQLFSAAASCGQARDLQNLSVPTNIEYLYIAKPEGEMQMFAEADATPRGMITGNGVATAGGKVVLELKGLKLFPIADDEGGRGPDPHAATRIHWSPDVSFLDVKDLVRPADGDSWRHFYLPVERLALLCTIESSHLLESMGGKEDSAEHLKKYRAWLKLCTEQAAAGNNELVEETAKMAALSSEERQKEIETLTKQIKATPTAVAAVALRRIHDNIKAIYAGEAEPLNILIQDDVLTQLYNMGDRWAHKDFFAAIRHAKPWLRILEIGAGTGGTTATVLGDLVSPQGERMYGKYSYTDISSGFFIEAKERFAAYQNIEYSVLDISKDPVEQGFEAGSYDLIIATNVLHATPKIGETLKNVHTLLRPDGHLFLDELCSTANWLNYIMGTLSGWWLGEADGRAWEPYVHPDRWAKEMAAVGFATPTVVYDDVEPYQANALIVASPALEPLKPKTISLLSNDTVDTSLVTKVKADFTSAGYTVEPITLSDTAKPAQDIISILDFNTPFLENISSENYASLNKFLQTIDSDSGMLWATRAAQINCRDPRWAQSIGLCRAVRNELAVECATLELDELNDQTSSNILKVYQKFSRREEVEDYDPDYEWAVDNGKINIPRFHWFSINKELAEPIEGASASKRLQIGKRGFLNTLQWVQRPAHKLVDDQVEVEVKAVGMNFKDVLIAQGIVEGHRSEGEGLGCECAGIIRAVGPEVSNVKVGEKVIVFAGGSYSTNLVTRSSLCAKMAEGLSFDEAATMPCVYSTVIHSVIHLGRLRKGRTVLIQSACGGIGIAAIQVAKMLGAEIYCTVGTPEKVDYLMKTYGIPREHIFNSRNATFLPDIMKATNNKGVDLVLNSLSGELLHASWQCVAPYGSMVEIGKRDFIGRARLNMDMFESNRSFHGVDFAQICAERPDMTQKILAETMEYYSQGKIGPITPITHFTADKIEAAFRFMQKGSHIGKVVVTMPEDPNTLETAGGSNDLELKSDASYLMVGGLGGLGRAVSTWMVEKGAKNLVFLSRSAGKSESDQAFFRELKSHGCDAQAVPGSIFNLEDVQKAINGASMPVAGVLQMSMILKDGPLDQMSIDDWEAAVKPKVQGTWNLHKATEGLDIDFMVMFSSFSGLVGQRGQANYASANTFLDAFVQYRHKNGLAASVLDIGPIEDIGYVSTNKMVLDQFKATNLHVLQEADLLDSLHLAIIRSTPVPSNEDGFVNNCQVGIGLRMTVPSQAPNNRCIWKRDRRMAIYRNIEAVDSDNSADSSTSGVRQFLGEAEANPAMLREVSSVEFIAMEMGKTLHGFLLLPLDEVDINRSISSMGVDSLVAIELRNWCRHKMGIEMTVLEILDFPTLEIFGQNAAQRLYSKFGGGEEHIRESFLTMKAP